MHLAQAKTLLPEANRSHWRLGYFLTLVVGLYFPLNLTRTTPSADFFPQIVQTFSDIILNSEFWISIKIRILNFEIKLFKIYSKLEIRN